MWILKRYKKKLEKQFKREQVNRCQLELTDEAIDKQKLTAEVKKTFQDICRLNVNQVDFVPKGTIPDGAKVIVDERTY